MRFSLIDAQLGGRRPCRAGRRRRLRRSFTRTASSSAATRRAGKVGLISGGASGHEPLHGGFVGPGMLDAACAGEVFTSPVPDQMLAATNGVDSGAGVLHVVKNYTRRRHELRDGGRDGGGRYRRRGGLGGDQRRRRGRGQPLYRGPPRGGRHRAGRKDARAAAEEGRPLAAVAEIARKVNANGRSMGMALTSCTVPAAGKPTFDLPEGEMENRHRQSHGEPGAAAYRSAPAAEIAEMLVSPILSDLDFTGGGVIAFVNGMGPRR